MTKNVVDASNVGKPEETGVVEILGSVYNLFGADYSNGIISAISDANSRKASTDEPTGGNTTNSQSMVRHPHSVAVNEVLKLKDISSHHCACIQAKKYSNVGLGFIDKGDKVKAAKTEEEAAEAIASLLTGQAYVRSKVDEIADPFTYFGFNNELLDIAEDFEDTGTGYMEVARDESGTITWLGQIPRADIWPVTQGKRLFYYYRDPSSGSCKYFSSFGTANKEWLFSEDGPYSGASNVKRTEVSEVIPFICPSNRVKFQGYPEWLSASTDIDMVRKAKQYKTDFYHNRGVLDYIVSVTGTSLDSPQWDAIKANIKASTGMGNNFKSMAVNLGDPDASIEIHRLAMDMKTEDQFAKDNETLSQNIVSAHRVPPLLANILIPGKLGSSNEFINALIAFQLLVVGPRQNIFQSTLGLTLGGDEGLEGLTPDDFRLRTITSQINITGLDTVSKMRSEATDGNKNSDRDVGDGVKD